jgi:ferrous-iron efflux pump FieF
MSHAHVHTHGLTIAESSAITRRVTRYSVAVAVILIAIKGWAWIASGSVAMLASLADSGLDLVASLVTFFVVRYAATPPDAEHRFGHGKAEAFASLIQGGLVFASAALVGREAVAAMIDPEPLSNSPLAIAVMLVSLLLTGLLITAQTRALKKTSSVAVTGDRAHYAADLGSNLVVLVGIGGFALTGLTRFDAVAGLIVTLWLVWGAINVFREAAGQLMDRELPDEARAHIKDLVTADGRISGVHNLRTRASGPVIHIQLHADLDPNLTLVAAHEAVVAAEERLLVAFPAADIIIHPDPRGKAEPHGGPFMESH